MKNLFLFCLLLFASNQLLGAFVIPNAINATDETSGNKVNQSNGLKFLDENFAESVVESILDPGLSSEILGSLELFEDSEEDLPVNLTESLIDPVLTNIGQSINEVLLQNATEFFSAPDVPKPSNSSDDSSGETPSNDTLSDDAPSTDASANVSESPDGRILVNSSESSLNKIDYRDRDGELY